MESEQNLASSCFNATTECESYKSPILVEKLEYALWINFLFVILFSLSACFKMLYHFIRTDCCLAFSLSNKFFFGIFGMGFDIGYFKDLGAGKMLHDKIHLSNFIFILLFIFIITGTVKIIIMTKILKSEIKSLEGNATIWIKFYENILSFLLQDGPELAVQYYFVEKYTTQRESWVLFKSIFMSLLALYSLYKFVKHCMTASQEMTFKGICIIGLPVIFISITYFLRTYAALHQMNLGTIRDSCFKLEDQVLSQSPFDLKCYGKTDILLLGLLIMSTIVSVTAAYQIMIRRDDTNIYQSGTEMK
jgi:cell division protein FtsL